jgi:hypothetical protein
VAQTGLTWFSPEDEGLRLQLVRYTIAFGFALKVHLRADEVMATELESAGLWGEHLSLYIL